MFFIDFLQCPCFFTIELFFDRQIEKNKVYKYFVLEIYLIYVLNLFSSFFLLENMDWKKKNEDDKYFCLLLNFTCVKN